MFGLGTTELIIILVIVVMLFGVGKLPMVAKELGAGMKTFKKSLNDDEEEEEDVVEILEKKTKVATKETESQTENW